MTIVVDASLAVAALISDDAEGIWAETLLGAEDMMAPHLMPVEAANILRRLALAQRITNDAASLAHADLLRLPVELVPYQPLAARAWELRLSLTLYDACYVALAEAVGAPLATLDRRLAQASGPRCDFLVPPAS